jgi:hypothetical protein
MRNQNRNIEYDLAARLNSSCSLLPACLMLIWACCLARLLAIPLVRLCGPARLLVVLLLMGVGGLARLLLLLPVRDSSRGVFR